MLKSVIVKSCIFHLTLLGYCCANKTKQIQGQEIYKLNKKLGLRITTKKYIKNYEQEHQMMYRNEDGTIDESKYLQRHSKLAVEHPTEYCRKYLQFVIPKRDITGLYGEPDIVQLLYTHLEMDWKKIVAMRCELPIIKSRLTPLTYYVAEAPHHCAYTILRIGRKSNPFRIVSKVCDFENDNSPHFKYTRNNLKNETGGNTRTYRSTGIPIASYDLIEEYEYQHQEMHRNKEGITDKKIYWTWPKYHEETYLNAVCSHYLKAVVPKRAKDMISMTARLEAAHIIYNVKNKGFGQYVAIIQCHLLPVKGRRRHLNYYMTEAPDKNCVFTLIRPTRKLIFNIVFRVCEFINDKSVSKNDVYVDDVTQSRNLNITKEEDQEDWENKPDLETLPILPKNWLDSSHHS